MQPVQSLGLGLEVRQYNLYERGGRGNSQWVPQIRFGPAVSEGGGSCMQLGFPVSITGGWGERGGAEREGGQRGAEGGGGLRPR